MDDMDNGDYMDPESEEASRARVPSHFFPIRKIGGDSLSGAVFLCLRAEDVDRTKRTEARYRGRVMVKVPNGSVRDGITSVHLMREEVETVRELPRHPRIVHIVECSGPEIRDHPYIAMQPVEGEDLIDRWRYIRDDSVPESRALVWSFIKHCSEALLFLHHGIDPANPDAPRQMRPSVHGDIRAANIMLDKNNQTDTGISGAVLIDFGMAVIRSLDNPRNLRAPRTHSFIQDVSDVIGLAHALAHQTDIEEQPIWRRTCECRGLRPSDRHYGTTHANLFTYLGDHFVNDRDTSRGHRKELLLELHALASSMAEKEKLNVHIPEDMKSGLREVARRGNPNGPDIDPANRQHPPLAADQRRTSLQTRLDTIRSLKEEVRRARAIRAANKAAADALAAGVPNPNLNVTLALPPRNDGPGPRRNPRRNRKVPNRYA